MKEALNIRSICELTMKNYTVKSEKQARKIEKEILTIIDIGFINLKYNKNNKTKTKKITNESKEVLKGVIIKILESTYCIGEHRLTKYLDVIFDGYIEDFFVFINLLKKMERDGLVNRKEFSHMEYEYELETSISTRSRKQLALSKHLYRKKKIEKVLKVLNK